MESRGYPPISIVIAVKNGAATLECCLSSVIGQSYPSVDLIVVDGGSTDGTVEIIEHHAANIAWWITEPDKGIYAAWNKGLAHARGDWICFLGADDYLWTSDVLERIAPALVRAHPPVRVVYGQVAVVNQRGEEVSRMGEDWRSAKKRFEQIMCIPHTGLMHHRSLFEKNGKFDESFRIAGDYELLIRELRTGEAFFVPDLVVAGMRHGGISSDPSGSLTLLREIRRAQRMHGIGKPGRHWISAFAKAHIRVWLWRVLGNRIAPYVFDFGRLINGKRPYWTRQ